MPDIGAHFPVNTAYLDPSDWTAFEQAHPEAAADLRFRAAIAEAAYLEDLQRSRRQDSRLAELRELLAGVALTLA